MIIHVVGKPRQGKGVLMSYLALPEADSGTKVDCNYHLESTNANYIGFYDLLSFLKKPRVDPPHLLVLDELPGWCDSYVTSSKSNRFATHFVNQSAKLGYNMIFSSQRSKRADINFRENIDHRFQATKKCACNKPKCPSDCKGLSACHFNYQPLDIENDEQDVPIGKPFKLPFEFAKDFWKRFDTFEAVPPIGLDEVLMEMQKYDPAKMNETVDKQVSLLMEVWKPYYIINTGTVKDLLLEHLEPLAFVDVVCSRLKRRQQEKKEERLTDKTPNTTAWPTPQIEESAMSKWLTQVNKS